LEEYTLINSPSLVRQTLDLDYDDSGEEVESATPLVLDINTVANDFNALFGQVRQVTKENIDKFLDDMIRLSPSPQTLKSERGDFFGLRDQLRRNRRFIDNKKMRRKKK
jgi:hypothetical protein